MDAHRQYEVVASSSSPGTCDEAVIICFPIGDLEMAHDLSSQTVGRLSGEAQASPITCVIVPLARGLVGSSLDKY